jgi:AcrR family transcriptional regulator
MSSQNRRYELKARAESQRETRERIARVAAGLHEEKGVAATTVAEIARRAGVSRLTVYNHFPDLAQLLQACSAHYETLHPFPDLEAAMAAPDPAERVRITLGLLYGWYRETEPMFGKLFHDRSSVPELEQLMQGGIDHFQGELAGALTSGFKGRGPRAGRRAALIRLALDFWTWKRLTGEGLDDEASAQVMAAAVAGA